VDQLGGMKVDATICPCPRIG